MKRRSKRLKTKQAKPQTSLSLSSTTQTKSKPNLTTTRISRSRSNANLKAELSEDCCDNAKIETFLKQKEQSIDMSSRASTSSSSGELASTSSSTESKELKESSLTSSVSYLPIELKLTSIDLSCKDFKPLEDNFLLADSTGLTGHIKKLIAKAMNISLNKFEVFFLFDFFYFQHFFKQNIASN